MVKALATIGYHSAELEWGRVVRAAYEISNLGRKRDIAWYEITDSDVGTGGISEISEAEAVLEIEAKKADLWIDIHCGIHHDIICNGRVIPQSPYLENQLMMVIYLGPPSSNVEEAVKQYPEYRYFSPQSRSFRDNGSRYQTERVRVPRVVIDPCFLVCNFFKGTATWEKHLKDSVEAINRFYDLHHASTAE